MDGEGRTVRQLTGETQKDYQYYPQIKVVLDADGVYVVKWNWNNKFPDGRQASESGSILNTFEGKKGESVVVELIDNRPGIPGGGEGLRDTNRNGSIAIGDVDFVGLQILDGVWHSFRSDVYIEVTSPSGKKAFASGTLSEIFKYNPPSPPPSSQAVVNVEVYTYNKYYGYYLSPTGEVYIYKNGQEVFSGTAPDGVATVILQTGTYTFIGKDFRGISGQATVTITGDTTVRIHCGG
ncbi:MAG: hypothetical protein QXI36_02105 [Candidatus Bathyarchaeia archaeon]